MDIDISQVSEESKKSIIDLMGLFNYQITTQFRWLVNCEQRIILLPWGNQTGKTHAIVMDWLLSVLGIHPVKWKNLMPEDKIRTYRVCAEVLPTDKAESEVQNTVYPHIMRCFPPSWLKKDVTIRNPVQTWRSPLRFADGRPAPDFYIEYVSYGQSTQRQAGHQRKRILIDEGPSYEFFDEQWQRLTAAEEERGSDLLMSYTPTETQSAWIFDHLYDRAKVIYRTPSVLKEIYRISGKKEKHPPVEKTDSTSDVSVIMASQYDNPTFSRETVDKTANDIADPDVKSARIYGLFRQISGKVFKTFNSQIHVVDLDHHFEEGLPSSYRFARGIDYHPNNPWGCTFVAVSPMDEIFVWEEYNPNPDKILTSDICEVIAIKSGHHTFYLDKIDPLSKDKQGNSGLTSLQDINNTFYMFKKEGRCTGAYFTPWDTKSTKGLDEFRKRLRNSVICGKPFNNTVVKDGRKERLPTIWIGNNCPITIEMMKKWKWQDYASKEQLITKDPKGDRINERQQKYSHIPIAIECLLKYPEITQARFRDEHEQHEERPRKTYFQGGRR